MVRDRLHVEGGRLRSPRQPDGDGRSVGRDGELAERRRLLHDRTEHPFGRAAGKEPPRHGILGERRHQHVDRGLAVGSCRRHAYTV
jgi:hypothetical protein